LPIGQLGAAEANGMIGTVGIRKAVVGPVAEKIPLFLLTGISCVVTFLTQQAEGAVMPLGLKARMGLAVISYGSYIWKIVWPSKLAVFYPLASSVDKVLLVGCAIFLTGVTAASVYWSRRRPWFLVGWLWYLGTLVPVIGLVQVGAQSMADRYTYLPSIGILIMVAWGAARLSNGWRRRNMVFAISTGLLLVGLILCTRAQVRHWKNTLALFGHGVQVTPNNPIIHYHYGDALLIDGRLDEAAFHFQEALRINPLFEKPYDGLARSFYKQGKIDETIAVCKKRLRIGKPAAAIYFRLGMAYYSKGDIGRAIQSFKESLRLKPDSVPTHGNLAKVLVRTGNPDVVITHLTEAIQLNPNIAPTHRALALAFRSKGRTEEAITHFREALRIKPNWEEPMNSLAWILATHSDPKFRNPQEAMSLAIRTCELANYEDHRFLDTLAAAYAAAGRFSDAVATAEKAVQIVASGDNKKRIQNIRNRLDLYRQQKPYRQP